MLHILYACPSVLALVCYAKVGNLIEHWFGMVKPTGHVSCQRVMEAIWGAQFRCTCGARHPWYWNLELDQEGCSGVPVYPIFNESTWKVLIGCMNVGFKVRLSENGNCTPLLSETLIIVTHLWIEDDGSIALCWLNGGTKILAVLHWFGLGSFTWCYCSPNLDCLAFHKVMFWQTGRDTGPYG